MKRKKSKFSPWFLELLKILETPHMNLVEWADNYRILGRETSAEAGKWNTSRTPYMEEIMLSISDKTISKVSIMSSAQVGKSELGLNFIAYTIDVDPRSMLVVLPTEDTAKMFSVERIDPMIKNTPRIRDKMADDKTRDKQNTMLNKSFEGGYLSLVGANAPSKLASRPVGVVILDEIDRFPLSAGKEGDPVSLATKRTTTFFDRKIIQVSTPVIKGASRIEKCYNEGSRGEWCLPCPKCNNLQPLEFDLFDINSLKLKCSTCNESSTEFEWKRGLKNGKWIHGDPESKDKSYHLNAFTSPWVSWREISDEYTKALNDGSEMLKTFYNLTLGLPYEEIISYADSQKLYDMRESYSKLPTKIVAFTCGVDVQDDRLEYDIKGWLPNCENYGVQKGIIYGSPAEIETWNILEDHLSTPIPMEDGTKRKVKLTFVDSGGHYTRDVYKQCYRLMMRRKVNMIFPIKGEGGANVPIVSAKSDTIIGNLSQDGYKITLMKIGVNAAKNRIMEITNPDSEYFRSHYPNSEISGYNLEYFNQLFAEKLVERKKNGNIYYAWEPVRKRNEALDCAVYSLGAFLRLTGGKM